jgi:hypothetical protein
VLEAVRVSDYIGTLEWAKRSGEGIGLGSGGYG